jgi:peptidoglycan biosynthesis protein MviN/MurJ (putative lipid II flippase)
VNLYAHALTGPERHLTVIFAFFFIPQIFFYGVSSLAGGVLNARGRFAAPMWTPVINNIVVILVLLLFIATGGIGVAPGSISDSQIQLLGIGTTLGIIAQTAAMITALLPRMSAHAAEHRLPLVRSDFSTGVRLSSAIVVPAALLLIVLGAPLAEFLFAIGHGSTSVAEARYIGEVFGVFSLGLVPYMMFQLMLRVFYALHDSRTPMFIGVAVMATNIAASLLALRLLPAGHVVEGLGVAFGLSNVVGAAVSWWVLRRRLGGLAGRQIASTLVRMHLAAVPALLFAWAVTFMIGVIFVPGPVYGLVTVVIGGSGGLLLYLLFARALRISEVTDLTSTVQSRLRR